MEGCFITAIRACEFKMGESSGVFLVGRFRGLPDSAFTAPAGLSIVWAMAILKIARMGHPVLRRRADRVDDPTDPKLAHLVADMIDTLEDAGGVGLAAPQVYVPLRVVLFYVPGTRSEAGDDVPLTVLVNPEIEVLDPETDDRAEACLSVPGMAGTVPRPRRIGYRALDLDGRLIEREAQGFHARVVQHECDHLDGVLYPMRMTDLGTFGFVDELRKPSSPASPTKDA